MSQPTSVLAVVASRNFRPLFVFVILSGLLIFTLSLLAFFLNSKYGSEAIVAVLNTAVGAELGMLGVIVNAEFGSSKARETGARATDSGQGAE